MVKAVCFFNGKMAELNNLYLVCKFPLLEFGEEPGVGGGECGVHFLVPPCQLENLSPDLNKLPALSRHPSPTPHPLVLLSYHIA